MEVYPTKKIQRRCMSMKYRVSQNKICKSMDKLGFCETHESVALAHIEAILHISVQNGFRGKPKTSP